MYYIGTIIKIFICNKWLKVNNPVNTNMNILVNSELVPPNSSINPDLWFLDEIFYSPLEYGICYILPNYQNPTWSDTLFSNILDRSLHTHHMCDLNIMSDYFSIINMSASPIVFIDLGFHYPVIKYISFTHDASPITQQIIVSGYANKLIDFAFEVDALHSLFW